jgi:hypothetical protein
MKECSCGDKFRGGEDYRDHLPCPGYRIVIEERKRISNWLMLMQIMPHKEPADYAVMIENLEHHAHPTDTVNKYMEKKA